MRRRMEGCGGDGDGGGGGEGDGVVGAMHFLVVR